MAMYDPMPGTMLHEQNTPQFGGAGVMRRGDGRVTFVGGSPLKFVPPASKYASLDEWQANEQSRRMRSVPFRGAASPQLVAGVPGVPGVPGAPGPATMANAATPAPSPDSPFLTGSGLKLNPNLPVPEYNRRMSAMMNKQNRMFGSAGVGVPTMIGAGLMSNRDNNQFAANRMASQAQAEMDLLKQRQTMEMPASQKAQMDMLAGIASSPNLGNDQRIALAQAAMGLARPGGSLSPDVLEGLKTNEVVPLSDTTGMNEQQKHDAYIQYDRNNPRVSPERKAQIRAQLGITGESAAREALRQRPNSFFSAAPGSGSLLANTLDFFSPERAIDAKMRQQREQGLSTIPGATPLIPQDNGPAIPSFGEMIRGLGGAVAPPRSSRVDLTPPHARSGAMRQRYPAFFQ